MNASSSNSNSESLSDLSREPRAQPEVVTLLRDVIEADGKLHEREMDALDRMEANLRERDRSLPVRLAKQVGSKAADLRDRVYRTEPFEDGGSQPPSQPQQKKDESPGRLREEPAEALGLEQPAMDGVGGQPREVVVRVPDAPRRLFYVAMTRARRNLVVMSNDNHEYLPSGSSAILTRRVTPDLAAVPGPRRYFQSAEARMVDLSFAGRLRDGSTPLAAISEARVGDPVTLVEEKGTWILLDARGRSLGRMAKKNFSPPKNARFARGEIAAILRRYREDSEESFHHMLKREIWEVIVPELVFEEL